jgi:hypothetical protein
MTATKIDNQKDAAILVTPELPFLSACYLPAIKDRDRTSVYEVYRGFGPGGGFRRPSFFDRDG